MLLVTCGAFGTSSGWFLCSPVPKHIVILDGKEKKPFNQKPVDSYERKTFKSTCLSHYCEKKFHKKIQCILATWAVTIGTGCDKDMGIFTKIPKQVYHIETCLNVNVEYPLWRFPCLCIIAPSQEMYERRTLVNMIILYSSCEKILSGLNINRGCSNGRKHDCHTNGNCYAWRKSVIKEKLKNVCSWFSPSGIWANTACVCIQKAALGVVSWSSLFQKQKAHHFVPQVWGLHFFSGLMLLCRHPFYFSCIDFSYQIESAHPLSW